MHHDKMIMKNNFEEYFYEEKIELRYIELLDEIYLLIYNDSIKNHISAIQDACHDISIIFDVI